MYTSTSFIVDPVNKTNIDDYEDDSCSDDNTWCAGRRLEISVKTNPTDATEYIDTSISF